MIFGTKTIQYFLILVIIFTVIKQSLMNQVIFAFSNGNLSVTSEQIPNASLATSILPTDKDEIRPYKWKNEDVTLKKYVDTNGKQMVEMEKEIADSTLTDDQKSRLAKLGKLPHPCCDAPIDTKDCLHAQAAMGLIKYLITLGWDDNKIKQEILLWYKYWWPRHYAIAATYLNSKGTDPAKVSIDDWLGEQLSTVRSEQIMVQALSKN